MQAAVVRSFGHPPRYEAFAAPQAQAEHEVVADVLAAGLHPRVRSSADGSHYTSTGALPFVPGIDGVGRLPGGELVYFVLPETVLGSMAERTVIDLRRSAPLPAAADPVALAAAMNPAMSSWVALRRRVSLAPGARVLVLGATGNAGRMAIAVARLLGAGHVVAAGRGGEERLADAGADVAVGLDDDALGKAGAEVDVVLDYLWGEPAARTMVALVKSRRDRGRALDWVQIGSVAGPDIALPSAALRAANLRVLGSGQGSVPTEAIVEELPVLAAEITAGTLRAEAEAVALRDVEAAWTRPPVAGRRVVLVP